MLIFFIWISLSILAAYIASNKGNSGLVCFLGGIIFSPLVGLLVAILSPQNNQVALEKQKIKNGYKKCKFCAELIKREAVICHYCKMECVITPPSVVNTGSPSDG
jgi:hypothetical protein